MKKEDKVPMGSFEQYQKEAESGNVDAQYNLGRCYFEGQGVKEDKKKAVEWYKKAAESGHAKARVALGICYCNNIGVDSIWHKDNCAAGLKWFLRAAEENDDIEAMRWVASSYWTGFDPNLPLAVEWYEKILARERDAVSLTNLAQIYLEGDVDVPGKKEKAVALLMEAVEQNNYYADAILGFCYMNGKGVAQDYSEALKWLQKSVADGVSEDPFEESQVWEGIKTCKIFVEEGDAVGYYKKACEFAYCGKTKEAAEYLTKAAELGDAESQYWLGNYYENGTGVKQNYKKMVEWYKKSAEAGYQKAQLTLAEHYEKGIGVKQSFKKMIEWYTKCAEAGDLEAQIALAVRYRRGDGVKQYYKKMIEWYTKSAEAGSLFAQMSLAECYQDGLGVKQDYAEAARRYKIAQSSENFPPHFKGRLAVLYYKGLGVEQDYAMAVRLAKEAVCHYSSPSTVGVSVLIECCTLLSECFEKGLGVEKDPKMAKTYFDRIDILSSLPKKVDDDDDDDDDEEYGAPKLLHYVRAEDKEYNFVEEIESCKIDKEKVSKVENLYGIKAPNMLKRMITMCTDDDDNMLSNDLVNIIRFLTFDELMHPEKIFGDNFKSRGFVPVAECLNGDFLGYDKKLKKWLWLGVLGRKKEEVYMDEEDVMDILWEIEDEVSR
ncbi:MAG: sel1 repeat family protein [Paludibacteraceae bacterium]|nr:sel1 repeat family protein [Paludibacteraceae bacterium]